MVLYGLKSQIGTVYRNSDWTTSFYDIGNFLYLAGELDPRFWEDFVRQYGLDYKIIISEDTKWQDFLHRQVGLISFTRYSFKDKQIFQVEFLNDSSYSFRGRVTIISTILTIVFITIFLRKNGHKIYRGILSPTRILL